MAALSKRLSLDIGFKRGEKRHVQTVAEGHLGNLFLWSGEVFEKIETNFRINLKAKILPIEATNATGDDLHGLISQKISDLFSGFMAGLRKS